MKALVVYESMYGNTREIAEAVADGLRESAEVTLRSVGSAEPPPADVDLLVVGGPTHIHGMASRRSHRAVLEDAKNKPKTHLEPDVQGPALRDWLEGLGRSDGRRAAAFDTRIGKSKLLTGSAAKGIARRLRGHGYEIIGDESFIVQDSEGPLHEGELERARTWGSRLAAR